MTTGRKRRLRRFSVSGREFTITYAAEAPQLGPDELGHSDYDLGEVVVRTHREGRKIPEDAIRETLWHEITHIALWAASLDKLARDEQIVCQVAAAVRQIFNTIE